MGWLLAAPVTSALGQHIYAFLCIAAKALASPVRCGVLYMNNKVMKGRFKHECKHAPFQDAD